MFGTGDGTPFTPITSTARNLGLTRDSALWFWSRLTSGALLILSGVVPLDKYLSEPNQRMATIACAIVLWLAGRYDSSPLGPKRE